MCSRQQRRKIKHEAVDQHLGISHFLLFGLIFPFLHQNEAKKMKLDFNQHLFAVLTRQVYNLFQEPVEQPSLGFSIAEEKIRQF